MTQKGQWANCESIQVTPYRGPIPLPTWRETRHDLHAFVSAEVPTVEEMRAFFVDSSMGGAASASAPAAEAAHIVPADAPAGTTIDPEVLRRMGGGGAAPPTAAAAPAAAPPAAAAAPAPTASVQSILDDPVLAALVKDSKDPEALAKSIVDRLRGATASA
jgi:hypothetical protein